MQYRKDIGGEKVKEKEKSDLPALLRGSLQPAVGAAWYLENNDLGTTQLFYQDDKLPVAFDGFRIVQVADLHDKRFGPRQERLLSALRAAKPDCIVMTGDLIDRRRKGGQPAAAFIQGAVEIAPVYFVTGNHEIGPVKRRMLSASLQKRMLLF